MESAGRAAAPDAAGAGAEAVRRVAPPALPRRGEARNALTFVGEPSSHQRKRPDGGRAPSSSDEENKQTREGGSAISPSVSARARARVRALAARAAVVDVDAPEVNAADVSACTVQTPETSEASGSYGSYYYSESTPRAAVATAAAKKVASERKEDIVHVEWSEGMMLKSRYRVSKLLGDGTFGRVLFAEDTKKDRQVAIKVIREVEKYVRNAKREAEILKDIRDADAKRTSRCVIMHDTFTHDGRLFCLAFEVLGASLYDVLKKNRFRGFWMQDIQSIARQCLQALVFLHEGMSLTHTDLKLENILFQSTEPWMPATFPREGAFLERHKSQQGKPHNYVRPATTRIKLIDFGNATYELEHHSSVINTRQYRAPEVILALGWNERSDLWSTGCIIMELYTGELLFRTHDSLEHLALMERIVEQFPQSMLDGASAARKEQCIQEADDGEPLRLRWPPALDGLEPALAATIQQRCKHVAGQQALEDLVPEQHKMLADFVGDLLRPDPSRRPSASAALKHPFFAKTYSD
eukprot:CAMPEP_0117534528 /NCGR_PEP_ID=MMETSP0784-20121206/40458_1 /TAXON_ID=39447 /ORGANISM="" /LENGTH=525 /DNA_ID=CAMNT_0005331011 /DNA_START=73 /DNA_END=1650 /DNA_ORIENTATION=+